MGTLDDQRFQLLISEKEFAETQIGSFFELHVKVLTFLGAAIVLLGWLYSDKPKPVGAGGAALISVAVVVVGCSVILQAIVLYGSSLGYLEYKMTTLNRQFMHTLQLSEPPFTAFWRWRRSSTQPPVSLSAIALFSMHAVTSSILLANAWSERLSIKFLPAAVIGAGVYLVVTLCAEVLVFRAIRALMAQGTPPREKVPRNGGAQGSEGSE